MEKRIVRLEDDFLRIRTDTGVARVRAERTNRVLL